MEGGAANGNSQGVGGASSFVAYAPMGLPTDDHRAGVERDCQCGTEDSVFKKLTMIGNYYPPH